MSLRRLSTVPWGNLAKASSVGAKTVKGPGLFNVSTSPAACTAVTNVLKLPADTAVSTISAINVHLPKNYYTKLVNKASVL